MNFEEPDLEKIDRDLSRSEKEVEVKLSPEMENALANFNEVIDKFPFLRDRMKAEILQWVSENISLQAKMLPFYAVQTVFVLLVRSGYFDQYINSAEELLNASPDEIFTMGIMGTVLTGQAVIKTKEKLKSLLRKNG